jgi:hypothetical protein
MGLCENQGFSYFCVLLHFNEHVFEGYMRCPSSLCAFTICQKISLSEIGLFSGLPGLALKPTTRFDRLIPITEPDEAARIIIESVLRNEKEVFIPRRLSGLFAPLNLFPLSVKLALFDYLGCGVGAHE